MLLLVSEARSKIRSLPCCWDVVVMMVVFTDIPLLVPVPVLLFWRILVSTEK